MENTGLLWNFFRRSVNLGKPPSPIAAEEFQLRMKGFPVIKSPCGDGNHPSIIQSLVAYEQMRSAVDTKGAFQRSPRFCVLIIVHLYLFLALNDSQLLSCWLAAFHAEIQRDNMKKKKNPTSLRYQQFAINAEPVAFWQLSQWHMRTPRSFPGNLKSHLATKTGAGYHLLRPAAFRLELLRSSSSVQICAVRSLAECDGRRLADEMNVSPKGSLILTEIGSKGVVWHYWHLHSTNTGWSIPIEYIYSGL